MSGNNQTLPLVRGDGRSVVFTARLCGDEDLSEILALQRTVTQNVGDSELFVSTTREELEDSLRNDWCLAVYDGDKMVAFTLMVRNRITERNLGVYLGYCEEELLQCVTYDTTFVHPDYRGFGLQRELGRMKDEAAVRMGAREALSTISPQNAYSLSNARQRGFAICEERILYSGVRRYLMRKEL